MTPRTESEQAAYEQGVRDTLTAIEAIRATEETENVRAMHDAVLLRLKVTP